MLETPIELIQTLGKFMLPEISPKCWSLQPNECELAALVFRI